MRIQSLTYVVMVDGNAAFEYFSKALQNTMQRKVNRYVKILKVQMFVCSFSYCSEECRGKSREKVAWNFLGKIALSQLLII